MTQDDRSLERAARTWLEAGPTQAPDRAVEAALLRIQTTPQARELRIPRRLPTMTTRLSLAATAVIGFLAIGTVLLLSAGSAPQVGHPSTVPSGSPNRASLSTDLQARWTSAGFHALVIDSTSIVMDEFKGPIRSGWAFGGPGTIAVTLAETQQYLGGAHWGTCGPGDKGTYGIALSADKETLTLSPLDDSCAPRSAYLAGAWSRWPCPNPASLCQPELTPGRHSAAFQPYADSNGNPPAPSPYLREYLYTVPTGWSELGNENGLGRPNDPGSMAVKLIQNVAPRSQASDCHEGVAPGIGRTSKAIADWLAGLPALVATSPQPITVGGYNGQLVDVSLAPTWTISCFGDPPAPIDFLFTDPQATAEGGVSIREGLEGSAHARYILVDVEKADFPLLIEITGPDEASWNDLVRAAMPIIETFQFTPAGP
jgi:hypothetical protein